MANESTCTIRSVRYFVIDPLTGESREVEFPDPPEGYVAAPEAIIALNTAVDYERGVIRRWAEERMKWAQDRQVAQAEYPTFHWKAQEVAFYELLQFLAIRDSQEASDEQ
jgi:hypothetical protein